MLVLARKVGEKVILDDNIVLVITEVRGNTVRLGFEAPPEVIIRRGEVATRDEEHFRNARTVASTIERRPIGGPLSSVRAAAVRRPALLKAH